MDNSLQELQFLDLDDINKEEAEEIHSILYTPRPTRLVFPWIQEETSDWNQQSNYEGDGSEGSQEVYPMGAGGMGVATTMQQVYQTQVVPPLQCFVPGYVQGYQPSPGGGGSGAGGGGGQGYDERRRPRGNKPSPKRTPVSYPVQYPPYHTLHLSSPPYQYMAAAGGGIPSAQHAAGHPLYLAPAPQPIPVYPAPHHMYPQYPAQVFGPLHDTRPKPPPPPQMEQEVLPPPAPVVQQVVPQPPVVPQQQDIEVGALGHRLVSGPPGIVHHVVATPVLGPPQPPVMNSSPEQQQQPPPPQEEEQPVQERRSPTAPVPAHHPHLDQRQLQQVTEGHLQVDHQEGATQSLPVITPNQPEEVGRGQSPEKVVGPKSLPPINAIKTTSLPSMKRKPTISGGSGTSGGAAEEAASVVASQVSMSATATTAASVPSSGGAKSWAGLFKPGDSAGAPSSHPTLTPSSSQPHTAASNPTPAESMQKKCKPPLNAVAVTPPPSHLVAEKPKANPAATHQSSTEDKKIAKELMTYTLEHRAVILTPRGLNNPSNYCYINATLQALLACAPFYNLIKMIAKYRQLSPHNKSTTPVIDSMIQFVSEFSPAPPQRLNRKEKSLARKDGDLDGVVAGPSFEPHYVYKMLHTVSSFLPLEGRQEDAEEFLNVLLNGLNDEMMELLKLVKSVSLSNGEVTTNGDSHLESDSDWKEVTNRGMRVTRRADYGRTPLSDIFMGQLRSRLHRSDSGDQTHTTDNIQPFFCLPLDVESSESVSEALDKMVGWDAIEGEDSWQQHYLEHAPPVLILHLKCFHYSQGRATKIAKSLEFPIDLKLDTKLVSMKPKMLPKSKNYKLFAVVYHEGKEVSKGHYLCDVFHVGSSGWIRYDDAVVKPVSEQQVLKPRPPRVPYLLYYRRSDTIVQHRYNAYRS